MAWRNLGFTRGNPKTKFSNADKERGKQNVHKFGQKDPRHVPDTPSVREILQPENVSDAEFCRNDLCNSFFYSWIVL